MFKKEFSLIGISLFALMVFLSSVSAYYEFEQDSVTAIIGGKGEDFKPELELSKWDKEVNLTIRFPTEKIIVPTLIEDKIKWQDGGVELNFYPIEKGFEFEVILHSAPESNTIDFLIEANNLKFYYQPPLTEKEIGLGFERPDNIVGSYAVYHAEKKGTYYNEAEAEKYKVGKAFHIYRPKAIDAKGWEVWCDLRININEGILSVVIPQDFLNTAAYPIRHASGLTIGTITEGGSPRYIAENIFDLIFLSHIAGDSDEMDLNGVLSNVKTYIGGGATCDVKSYVYKVDGFIADQHSLEAVSAVTEDAAAAAHWETFDFSDQSIPLMKNESYILGVIGDGVNLPADTDYYVLYDAGAGTYYWEGAGSTAHWDTPPDPWIKSSASAILSTYANYTAPNCGQFTVFSNAYGEYYKNGDTIHLEVQCDTTDLNVTFDLNQIDDQNVSNFPAVNDGDNNYSLDHTISFSNGLADGLKTVDFNACYSALGLCDTTPTDTITLDNTTPVCEQFTVVSTTYGEYNRYENEDIVRLEAECDATGLAVTLDLFDIDDQNISNFPAIDDDDNSYSLAHTVSESNGLENGLKTVSFRACDAVENCDTTPTATILLKNKLAEIADEDLIGAGRFLSYSVFIAFASMVGFILMAALAIIIFIKLFK